LKKKIIKKLGSYRCGRETNQQTNQPTEKKTQCGLRQQNKFKKEKPVQIYLGQ